METLLLNPAAVEESAQVPAVVDAVEAAFAAYARGDAQMPAKSYIDLPQYDGDFRSMPAYLEADDWDGAGIKWVNSHPSNPEDHGLPTVMGTMIYSDPETAVPLAIIDGTTLTRKRTGAAAAVATDHLAVADATSLGLVGAGVQARAQLDAIATVRDIETVVVADKDPDAVDAFRAETGDEFEVHGGSIADAVDCDVVSTTTPVRDPIVPREAVGDHTHINAMGADAEGKHELDDAILLDAKLVIDDHAQCTHSGEINVPYAAGTLGDEDIHAELGAVVIGEASGRTDDGITVFDSTGLAIQDVASAHVVYEYAREHGVGESMELVGTDL
ncbi:ornithine cyclodeaminase family protein [Halorientalis regularis]|jgi:alanine dehydrogenase|uniref:Alanine dehydrogenase n=1 Tax=Halorientalis regularis TaxID=660518 RepID=A0A1G7H2B8_9EURY|nr:ornithine cyclodeaminase family protein [Halorientalis regularis]SDE94557.1 L-alanine dehydrogenase [Halorientalis regularis]